MEFVQVAVFVLGVLSVGHSAPVTSCETLTQQLDIPSIDQLLGKWIYIADVTTLPVAKELTTLLVENMWVNITKADESNVGNVFQNQKTLMRCFSVRTNFTLENNTLTMVYPYQTSQTMLKTSCPDCNVFLSHFILRGNSYRGLQLTSRRPTLTHAEKEEFKKQAECLNFSDPAFMTVESDLCPDESVTQETNESESETETTDITSFITNETLNDALKLFEKISSNEAKLQKFVKLLSAGVIPPFENEQ